MTATPPETGAATRRISGVEADLRRVASLHGVYAAGLVLVGLFPPFAHLSLDDNSSITFTPLQLVIATSTYEVDHPIVLTVVSVLLVLTVLTAAAAFVVTAVRQSRVAATVAMLASIILLPVTLAASSALSYVDILEGVDTDRFKFDPLEVWGLGAWALLLGGLAGGWIGYVLRDQLEL